MKKSLLKIPLLSIIILLSINCFGKTNYAESKISTKTDQIVQKIEQINVLMGSAVFVSGTRPKQFENFQELKKNASIEELTLLTNHSNGVVRCYSFWALLTCKEINLFSIIKDHLNDDTIVQTQFGCEGSSKKVGDFFIELVSINYEDEDEDDEADNTKRLSLKDYKQLDSLLIYKENNLDSRFRAIENAEPTEFLYPKVRQLVIKEHNQSALVTLSKYKKEGDIDLILNNRDNDEENGSGYFSTYQAIQNFPDPRFLPFLEKNLDLSLNDNYYNNEWRELYKAIATYKNEKSLELLTIPFTKIKRQDIKKYHIDFVYDAILLNKCTLYDNLLWQIWQEENLITLDGFKYLIKLDSSKTYELSRRKLIPNYQIKDENTIPIVNESIFTDSLKETILNFILTNDKSLAYNIITNKISETDVIDFKIYCKKETELKDPYFIGPLFKRLKTESNPHVYLQIVETLISFKNDSINKRILETRKGNKNMNKNWGSQFLDEILKKNNIQ